MENRWHSSEQTMGDGALAECVRGSRMIGSEENLVLHGGGNSSIKTHLRDITGRTIDVIYVKGSGWNMGTIEPAGFAPLRLDRLRELLEVDSISDPEMVNELRCALLDASAPDPSIESLLHAQLPHRAVLHSHADAIVTLTNQPDPTRLVTETFGETVAALPYTMPGFDLAKLCHRQWPRISTPETKGLVLLNHGLFTFGATMEEAYSMHVELITLAEERVGTVEFGSSAEPLEELPTIDLATFRTAVSEAAGRPMIVSHYTDADVARFVSRRDLVSVATRGPATPEHVIRTKRVPLVGTDVAGYAAEYKKYFIRNASRHTDAIQMLDPAPRFVLDPLRGLRTVGKTVDDADIVHHIAMHTMSIIEGGETIGSYTPLDEESLFDVEYWELEQAKLGRGAKPKSLAGQVALVTGAASGIGMRCAKRLLELGASVAGIDIAAGVAEAFSGPAWLGIRADVTAPQEIDRALHAIVKRFGGLEILVIAAGIFGESTPITSIDRSVWNKTIDVNLNAVMTLLAAAHPLLQVSPTDARVVLVGSKNVAAPGQGAAAYSASKAAVTQLARVAALEWATDGVRVNVVHPDAVFDTALWTEELLEKRAKKYGMPIGAYKRRNLLSTTVSSEIVAQMVGAMCTEPFAATTGAQVPVDGGNERVV